MNPKYLKYGRLLLKQRELDLKARAIRNEIAKVIPGGFYTCATYSDNGIKLEIKLAEYLTLNPDAQPSGTFLHEKSEFNPETYARLEYPPVCLGEITPGKWLWVEARSGKFKPPVLTPTAPPPPQPPEPTTQPCPSTALA